VLAHNYSKQAVALKCPGPGSIPISALAVVKHYNDDRQHSDFSPSDRAVDVTNDRTIDDHAFLLRLPQDCLSL
jgi:hypothetical protein